MVDALVATGKIKRHAAMVARAPQICRSYPLDPAMALEVDAGAVE